MTSTAVLAAFLWAAPSYFLHVAAHEGSHALATLATGGRVTRFSVLPERDPRTGRLYFGYITTDYGRPPTPAQSFLVHAAPVLASVAWALIANEIRRGLPADHWLRGPLAVEVAFATADAWTWGASGYNPAGDGRHAAAALGVSHELAVAPALALTATLAFRW